MIQIEYNVKEVVEDSEVAQKLNEIDSDDKKQLIRVIPYKETIGEV